MDKKVLGLAAGAQGSVRKTGAILAAASVAVVVGNEICQRLAARGVIDNQLLFGTPAILWGKWQFPRHRAVLVASATAAV